MKIQKVYLLIVLCYFLSGCNTDAFWGNSVYEKYLNGGYYLDAVDEYEEMAVGIQIGEEGVGVIGPTVFAVGQNENFIIVKQHPLVSMGVINKKATNYFIIPLKYKVSKSVDKNYWGPLEIEQFEQKKRELKISDLQFTILFKEMD